MADHPRDVVEQALVRAEGRRGDALEDGAVVRTVHARVEESMRGRALGRP